ncbi:MAG: biotin--[acetyl-CoA-carboxylase] ligase [Gemmatimonadota bacterium]|nr:biotin--[acetyl-CoA-carboxylase] ligase [Gemmatimonadota bacterium]
MTDHEQHRLDTTRAAEFGLPGFEVWEEIGSTNDRARVLAREDRDRGWLVVGMKQTAGRGRRGTRWVSAPGDGVWMSMVLAHPDAMAQLPLLIGVACAEALEEVVNVPVTVKWPNDLIIDDRKLGGILVERGTDWVVAGIGINVSAAPDPGECLDGPSDLSPTALAEHARHVPSVLGLAGTLARRILDRLDESEGVDRALLAFRSRDALRGRWVQTDERGPGIARGVDEDGMLLLELDDGSVVPVRSGSVRVLPQP